MNRRAFNKALGGALAASILPDKVFAASEPQTASATDIHKAIPDGPPSQIAMLIHPSFIPLDLFGPPGLSQGEGAREEQQCSLSI